MSGKNPAFAHDGHIIVLLKQWEFDADCIVLEMVQADSSSRYLQKLIGSHISFTLMDEQGEDGWEGRVKSVDGGTVRIQLLRATDAL